MEKVQWNLFNKKQNELEQSKNEKNEKSSTLPRRIIMILGVLPHETLQRRFNREFQFNHKGLSTNITT